MIINGLHCDLFTTFTSIYLIGKDLFTSHCSNNKKEVKFWQGKYELSEDDLKSLSKPHFDEIIFVNNSILNPKFKLKTYGDFGMEICFQCYDLNNEELIYNSPFATNSGIIRTKYYAQFSLLYLLSYLSSLGKFMCFDAFGIEYKSNHEIYQITSASGMKIYHEIADEWMNAT